MKPPIYHITFLFLFMLNFPGFSMAEEKPARFSISGKITDKSSGEALVGATVFVMELKTGAVSDVYGNYSLTLDTGTFTLQ